MFQIIKETRIQFMTIRRYAYFFSLGVLAIGIISILAHKGLRLGIDFAGGRMIEYRFNEPLPVEDIRSTLEAAGIAGAEIQTVGHDKKDFIFRIPVTEEQAAGESPAADILKALQERTPGLEGDLRREELVGPRVGSELRSKAFWAVISALIGILLYVGWRYEFRFALGGVAALAHDVLITLFLFSLLDKEITIPIIAAFLTIGGYSINDTVVVFDRIREQSKLLQGRALQEVINISINKTLSRTLVTSVTTFFAAGALFFFGGEVIHDFAFAMMVGILVGTYSSVYVASALALDLSKEKRAA